MIGKLIKAALGVNPALIAAIVGILAAGFVIDWTRIKAAEKRGAGAVLQKAKEKGAENEVRADKAHAAARKPGAAERLRRDKLSCRDC